MGERRRQALLHAIGPANRVLLLDEPTSGLDAASVGLVEAVLRERLAGGGAAILLPGHPQPGAAERLASRHLEPRAEGRSASICHKIDYPSQS
jgi:ABC-type multidrug transport system ATPase subunit